MAPLNYNARFTAPGKCADNRVDVATDNPMRHP
jgi:hypothetical protein